jgi:hypothetical protein
MRDHLMHERAPHSRLLVLAGLLLGALLSAGPARAQIFPPPVAQPDGPFSGPEDTPLPIQVSELLANDDLGFPPAQNVTIFASPANGSLTPTSATSGESFTYTPNANFNGNDSFTYQLSNGLVTSPETTVTITVTAVNDAPVGVIDRSFDNASENTPLSIAAPGLLAGVTDPEGNALSAQIVTNVPTAAGSVALTGTNGAFTYTPAAGFSGTTSFTYRAVDNATPPAASEPATVTITVANVNDPPVATADAYNATEDTVLNVPEAQGVLTNDTDPDAGTTLTTTAGTVPLTPPSAGTLQLAANGSFQYTPAMNFSGSATFTYRARDNGTPPLQSAPATVTITVAAVNDAPIAVPDVYEANVGIALSVPAPGVLGNDTDVEGNALTAEIVSPMAPASGTLAPNPNGGFTYTPAAGFVGAASFTYRARDNGSPSAVSAQAATVTINVRNAPPAFAPGITAIPDQTATENVPFTANLATFFVDPEGAPLTFTVTGLPAGLTADANGSISGTPSVAAGVGTFPVNVVVSDGPNQLTATFTLQVLAAGRTDIAVTAVASPSPALLNQPIAWTFTVENRSSVENVGNVSLEATFVGPGAFTVTAAAPCIVTPQSDRTTMVCTPIGPFLAGGQTTVTATGTSAVAGDVLVVAKVKIVDPTPLDETPQNDTVVEAVSVGETAAAGPAQTIAATDLTAAASGDFNGDGFIDLAVATSSGAAIYANVADPAAPGGVKRALGTPRVPIDSAPSAGVAAADFDGDGAADLAVARASGPSVVLRNPKDGSFALTPMATAVGRAGDASNALAAGDLDGDGLVDIVFANKGLNRVYMNRSSGAFAEIGNTLGNDDSRDVVVANLGGDAGLEIVFANADGNATLHYFDRAANRYVELRLATGPATAVAAGDVNGDGRADLVFGGVQSKIVLLNVTPPGASPQFAATGVQLGSAPTSDVLLEDTDADGDLDVVAINTSGGHQVYANDGTGQFTLRPQQFASNGPRQATVAKLGADDRVDVAVVGNASLDIFYNDGFGNFGRGDLGAPILQLTGPASIDLTVEAVYTDAGATAIDAVDGDITARVKVDNPVNTAVVGTYTVTYNVTDSSGNAAAAVTRTVRVGVRTGTGGGGGGAIDLATLLGFAILLLGAVCLRPRRRNV